MTGQIPEGQQNETANAHFPAPEAHPMDVH